MFWSTGNAVQPAPSESFVSSASSQTLCDPEAPQATVATFVLEPWVLSPHDFDAFCSLREVSFDASLDHTYLILPRQLRNYVPKFVPNTLVMPHDRPWGQAQQLWAFVSRFEVVDTCAYSRCDKIHDRCEEHQCRFFIVTSYEQWAFGCFSKGTCCFVKCMLYRDNLVQNGRTGLSHLRILIVMLVPQFWSDHFTGFYQQRCSLNIGKMVMLLLWIYRG